MLHSLDLAPSFQVDNAHSCIASKDNDKTIEGAADDEIVRWSPRIASGPACVDANIIARWGSISGNA
jgi:hypothetical protein